ETVERHGIVRCRATVDAGDELALGHAGEMGNRGAYRLLQRMIELEIGLDRQGALAAIGEHTGVLAGAIVVQRREFDSGRRQFLAHAVMDRRMNPALERVGGAADPLEHVRDGSDVARLARMAGAKKRDLLRRVPEALDPAAGDEGQRLQRLERASRGRQEMRIAGGEQQPAVAVDDRDRSIVDTIDGVTAGDARKRNVRRRRGRDGRQGAGSCRKPLFYRGALPYVARSACLICSSAPGSSIVVRSPGSRPSASAWIERRNSLPERVFGSSVTKCTAPGRAIAPSSRSTVSITWRRIAATPSAVATFAGSLTTANATGICPLS